MASSRWKRFAFFERQSITISDAVMIDLAIADSSKMHKNGVSSLSSKNDRAELGFVIATAALPAHTKPATVVIGTKTNLTAETMTAQEAPPNSITAMWSSLTACHPTTDGSTLSPGDSNTVQLKSQGQSLLSTSSVTTTTLFDGLVLCLAASPNSSRVHCFDVTVRCNPTQSSTALAASEELDGWRGYWTPFPPTILLRQPANAVTTPPSTDATSSTTLGVLAIAACRIPTPNRQSHSALHVACLGWHNQLVVWEDPHLHLSCRLPVHDTTTLSDPTAIVYTVPSGSKWNSTNDGDACVVDISAGFVAVGTTTGVVVVYSYNPTTTTTTTPTASSVGIATRNKQLSRTLRPYLRISAPPVSDVQVVSVNLSLSPTLNKANVFVSYNRATTRSSPANVHSTGNTSAGICCYDLILPTGIHPSSSLLTSSSAAPPALAAPSARYDLDGRFVSSGNLVDSYTRRQGGRILTVVRPYS
jgi:hypothetical protein